MTDAYGTIARKNVNTAEAYVLGVSSFQTGGGYVSEFNLTATDGTRSVRGSGGSVPLDTPVHIVGSYDGTCGRVYLNGELVGERNASGTLADTGGDLQIGPY